MHQFTRTNNSYLESHTHTYMYVLVQTTIPEIEYSKETRGMLNLWRTISKFFWLLFDKQMECCDFRFSFLVYPRCVWCFSFVDVEWVLVGIDVHDMDADELKGTSSNAPFDNEEAFLCQSINFTLPTKTALALRTKNLSFFIHLFACIALSIVFYLY